MGGFDFSPLKKPSFLSITGNMANLISKTDSISFTDFPDDVLLLILSFLSNSDIASLSCTSLLKNEPKLWLTLCEQRWGSKTQIKNWVKGIATYQLLYKTLHRWENLIGFWDLDRSSTTIRMLATDKLMFKWGPDFITGTGVFPLTDAPCLWMYLSPEGKAMSFIIKADKDSIGIDLSLKRKNHFVIKENVNSAEQRENGGVRRWEAEHFDKNENFWAKLLACVENSQEWEHLL